MKYSQYAFILLNMLLWAAIGFLIWLLFGKNYFDDIVYAFCFAGYPSFFIGFLGGMIYLYRKA